MKSISNKTRPRNQKLKTLCTLDTSDIMLTNEVRQIIERKKNKQNFTKTKKHSLAKGKSQSITTHNYADRQKSHNYSRQKWQHMTLTTKTPKTDKKSIRPYSKSRQRIKTQYNQDSSKKIVLNNLQIFTIFKNVKFQMDDQYNIDPFYLVNTIKSTHQQSISVVKYLDRNKKTTFYVLKKSNNPKITAKYEKQIAIKEELTDKLKPHERKNLSCIYKVYRKDKNDHMHVVYDMEGTPLSWKKQIHRKLIHNLPKNNMQILKHLIVQLSKSIYILSTFGYYHSELKLKNIFLQLKQDYQNVKVSKQVKLGNLYKCLKIKDKKNFEKMQSSIYTPPQILNFIMFLKQEKHFNRSWLDYIYRYEDAWRVNVWSLGILILELLNQQPLQIKFLQKKEIIEFQKDILKKSIYLLDKITDPQLEKLLRRMLSSNPSQRPSPEQIIIALTA